MSSSLGIFVTAVYTATFVLLFGYGAYLLWRLGVDCAD
jgi:hypothetical protein